VDVTRTSVPAIDERPDLGQRPIGVRGYIALGALVLGALAALGAAFIEVPYYALAPGSVRETVPLIEVEEDHRFEPDGIVHFTTVSIRGRITPWEWLAGSLDPAVEIVHESVILRGRDPDENRRVNLQLMDTSKNQAVRLAFQRLGYDVVVPGGALITRVEDGQPADGLLEINDLILAVDDVPVAEATDLVEAISGRGPGDTVRLEVGRPDSDEVEHLDVMLAPKEEDPTKGFLGVGIETRQDVEFPFDVDIDSGSVGGPSAGLAFTLGVLDVLTPGEITGGSQVAVTGTIQDDLTVGPIGGLPQKAAAVKRAGIPVFLVPASQTEEELVQARELAGDDVTLIPVANLDEALAALEELGGNAEELATVGQN